MTVLVIGVCFTGYHEKVVVCHFRTHVVVFIKLTVYIAAMYKAKQINPLSMRAVGVTIDPAAGRIAVGYWSGSRTNSM